MHHPDGTQFAVQGAPRARRDKPKPKEDGSTEILQRLRHIEETLESVEATLAAIHHTQGGEDDEG